MAMPAIRKPAEVRREREIVRTALQRFLALVAPVTVTQIFSTATGKPLDPTHPGFPPYGRRALDRLRQKGILTLSGKFWRVSSEPEMREQLTAILENDKELDNLFLADKYLHKPAQPVTAKEADEIADAMEGAVSQLTPKEDIDLLFDPPPPVLPLPKRKEKASSPEALVPEEEGEEVPFPYYVARRFDMLFDELDDLRNALPTDTRAHLKGIEMHVGQLAGDVKTLTSMFLDAVSHIEQLIRIQAEDHEFLMQLRNSLKPKLPEERADHVVQR